MPRTVILAAMLLLSLAPVAGAADKADAATGTFTEGLAAYERGDHASAL